MKKRLFCSILVLILALSAIPVFADESINYSVDKSNVGSAINPLTVSCGKDGVKYLNMGDSIAYGYGLHGNMEMMEGLNCIEGSYSTLIRDYLGCKTDNFFQGAVCGNRVVDLCRVLSQDTNSYPKDYFSHMNDAEYLPDGKTLEYEEKLRAFAKEADFITITVGGNDTMSFILDALDDPGNYVDYKDMSKYYGKAAVASYNALKKLLLAQANLIDSVANKETPGTTSEKLSSVFDILDLVLYTMAGFVIGEGDILDIIHNTNPKAVIAVTGLPNLLNEYDFDVDGVIIDLEKVFTPMVYALNNVIKNAASEKSSYVRYIDISDVEHLPIIGEYGYTISQDNIAEFISDNGLILSHPSEKGQKQIADKIMRNFNFSKSVSQLTVFKNESSNLFSNLMSRLGITKIVNCMTLAKNTDFVGFLKNMLGLFKVLDTVLQAA